jgi:chromate transporter
VLTSARLRARAARARLAAQLAATALVAGLAAAAAAAARAPALRAPPPGTALLAALAPACLSAASAGGAAAASGAAPLGLLALFLFFAKVGSVLFGSGYVLLAYLEADLVERWHWLSQAQLLDAVAVGQLTPGPVLSSAAFIGYLLAGVPGAALATLGIFLPAFAFVALSAPLLPQVRRSALLAACLDGLQVASLALLAAVAVSLGRAALVDGWSAGLAAGTALLLYRGVNSAWLLALGAALGAVGRALG